jgi:Ca2+/H+ antiporter
MKLINATVKNKMFSITTAITIIGLGVLFARLAKYLQLTAEQLSMTAGFAIGGFILLVSMFSEMTNINTDKNED